MPIVGLIVGAALGLWIRDSAEFAFSGAFVGLIAGLIVAAWRKRAVPGQAVPAAAAPEPDARLAAIESRLARLEAALERVEAASAQPAERARIAPAQAWPGSPPAAAATPAAALAATVTQAPAAPPGAAESVVATNADGTLAVPVAPGAPPPPAAPPIPAYNVRSDRPNRVWAWIAGGNPLARIGILVLFVGVGFLLKYASEHFTVPIELRIAAVALGGAALLVLGWRLRERRADYAMILQGGGVGVLYLTVFAALKLYALLPPAPAFALLFAVAALSSFLAVRQDAMALAAVGVLGGFLAPILTATDSGNHVLLFSYYALLNAGIFAIAWFKAWRLLNLLGFAMTFVIGALWGVTRYRPEHFATTEPFLVLFFLFYVGIAVLYALRRSVEVRHYVDGTLVFGTPLVAAGLQHALVRPFEFGMAISALAASALYLVLARILWARRRGDLQLLVESFLALGIAFATLAVPFAFDARFTSATWALEGAAIVWVGARQQRLPARLFGLALQLAAGVAFGVGALTSLFRAPPPAWPVLNGDFVGAALVAAAGLLSAWLLHLHRDALRAPERALVPAAFVWGAVWWLVAGGREIDRWVAAPAQLAILVAFLAGTALAFALAARELQWPLARGPVYVLLAALLAIAIVGAVHGTRAGHPLGHGGALAWPFAVAVWIALLHMSARAEPIRTLKHPDVDPPGELVVQIGHAGLVWLLTVLAAHETAWLAATFVGPRGAWRQVPWGLVPALALLAICAPASQALGPVAANRHAYLVTAAVPLAVWVLAWSLFANVASDGDATPLPYVPLVNPLDLALGFVAAAIALWLVRLRGEGVDLASRVPRAILLGMPAALAFVWANALALRTIHHWYGVGWSLHALWASTLVQAALSLLWTAIALAAMVFANRRAARNGWIAGAALLAVVVVKLFVVDLSRAGGIERIVSFIGVGVLLLAIGYLAPVPPRRREQAS